MGGTAERLRGLARIRTGGDGFANRCQSDTNGNQDKSYVEGSNVGAAPGAAASGDARDLDRLKASWALLPESTRAAVLMLIQTISPTGLECPKA